MGRPPLHLTPTVVRLSAEILARIDTRVGPRGRAAFIRRAVEKEIIRLEKQAAAKTAR